MFKPIFTCIVLLISLFASFSYADEHDPLVNADVVDPAKYPAVIWIGYCTATVVGPRVLITAGHCAHGADVMFTTHGHDYSATITKSPYYDSTFAYFNEYADRYNTSDLALGLLDKPVDFIPVSIGGVAKTGKTGLLLGFGCHDRWGQYLDGQLRAGENRIYSVNKNGMLMKDRDGGASGCPGDSGGPTLVKGVKGNEMVLLGVHSQVGFAADSSRLPETFDARTDLPMAQEFLKNFAAKNKVDICGVTMVCSK